MSVNAVVCPKVIPGPALEIKHSSLKSSSFLSPIPNKLMEQLGTNNQESIDEYIRLYSIKADWGINSLLAYCCQSYIMIVDPLSAQYVTSLHGHRYNTTCVAWCPCANTSGTDRGRSTLLASGDSQGIIIVWDAMTANKQCVIDNGGKKAIIWMKWLNDQSTYLLVLSATSVLTLWNIRNRTKVWTKTLGDQITNVSINPFNKQEAVCCTTSGWIYTISDLNTRKAPEQVEKKLRVGGTQDDPNNTILRDFVYSPNVPNQIYLVTRKECATYDFDIKQTVRGKSFHGGKSDFMKLHVLENEEKSMFSIHADGSIAAWVMGKKNKLEPIFCDLVRGNKHGADRPGLLHSATFNPLYPDRAVGISADGKVWIWKLVNNEKWILEGLLESITSGISSMQVSPYDNLVAVGTKNGYLLIYNLLTNLLEYRYEAFNVPVRGVQWIDEHRIICFSAKQSEKSESYSSRILVFDKRSGKQSLVRKAKGVDNLQIRGIRVSPSGKYLLVLLKDRPVEFYELKNYNLVRILNISNITAIEWCPPNYLGAHKGESDHFYFTSADGTLQFYRVDQRGVFPDQKKPRIFSYSQITALAWKREHLVSGDTAGNINIFDLKAKQSSALATHHGVVKQLKISPDGNSILALFGGGNFAVIDITDQSKIGQSSSTIEATAIDWAQGNYPVVATKNGSILIFDIGLGSCNSSFAFRTLSEPIRSPAFLQREQAQYLKSMMENGLIPETLPEIKNKKQQRNAYGEEVPEDLDENNIVSLVNLHMSLLDDDLRAKIVSKDVTTAEKCLLTAKFFGDLEGIKFWTLALNFLKDYKENKLQLPKVEETKTPNMETTSPEPKKEQVPISEESPKPSPTPLPGYFNLFRSDDNVKSDELNRVKSHDKSVRESKSKDAPDLFSQIARSFVQVDKKVEAVNILMETPPHHKDARLNYLHACVIAASNSQKHFNETVQFVAKGFMSFKTEEDLDTAVELLCLIGEGFKACKFLQDFDRWEKAAKLAKCILPDHQSKIILTRWADHLSNTGEIIQAISVYLSLGLFMEVLHLLNTAKMYDIGAMFIKACEEFNVPLLSKETVIQPPSILRENDSEENQNEEEDGQKIVQTILSNYALHLSIIGNHELSKKYTDLLLEKYGHVITESTTPQVDHQVDQRSISPTWELV